MYEIFRRLLQEHGLTAYKFSRETGIAQSTLSDWKTGKSQPRADKLKKIADYFNVSVDYLMGNEQKKEPEGEIPFELTQDEYELLKLYRKSTPEERKLLEYLLKYGNEAQK